MARVLVVSVRTVKLLAGLVWHVGFIALLWKGARLLHAADALDPGRIWPWVAVAAALVIGALKARFLLLPAARKNIVRIAALEHPRPWNLYRPDFLVFLAAFVLAAAWVLPRIWRGVRALWGRVLGTRRRPKAAPAAEGLPLAWNLRPLKD